MNDRYAQQWEIKTHSTINIAVRRRGVDEVGRVFSLSMAQERNLEIVLKAPANK